MEIKTLASCNPHEFASQTVAIAGKVETWLTATDIANIRKRLPHKEFPTVNMTTQEKSDMEQRNKEAMERQVKENLTAIFHAVLEDHVDETLEILALCCFVDPKDVDKYPMSYYMQSITELINDKNVIGFFMSLIKLEQMLMPSA